MSSSPFLLLVCSLRVIRTISNGHLIGETANQAKSRQMLVFDETGNRSTRGKTSQCKVDNHLCQTMYRISFELNLSNIDGEVITLTTVPILQNENHSTAPFKSSIINVDENLGKKVSLYITSTL